jgi:hypothetical protein
MLDDVRIDLDSGTNLTISRDYARELHKKLCAYFQEEDMKETLSLEHFEELDEQEKINLNSQAR